ncbi:MAG: DUF2080 family transposase-associated protein [bacterium]|nr:DUF2080 family transposase-associated protein [bacterium]
MEPFNIALMGYGIEEKIPVKSGNSSRIYLPAAWAGKKVRVVLVEPLED